MRSSVDLPQPDGPTSTTNSPSAMSTLTPCNTSKAPKAFRTLRMSTVAINPPHGGGWTASHYFRLSGRVLLRIISKAQTKCEE